MPHYGVTTLLVGNFADDTVVERRKKETWIRITCTEKYSIYDKLIHRWKCREIIGDGNSKVGGIT